MSLAAFDAVLRRWRTLHVYFLFPFASSPRVGQLAILNIMRPRHFAFRGVSRAFRSGQTYVDLVDQARLKAQIVKVRCRERLLKALDLREPIHRMRPEAGEHLDNFAPSDHTSSTLEKQSSCVLQPRESWRD